MLRSIATLAAVSTLLLAGCGSVAAPAAPTVATLASAADQSAQGAHQKKGDVLAFADLQLARQLVRQQFETKQADLTTQVTIMTFNRTAAVGVVSFTATVSTVGFAGFPILKQVSGVVNLTSKLVTVTK